MGTTIDEISTSKPQPSPFPGEAYGSVRTLTKIREKPLFLHFHFLCCIKDIKEVFKNCTNILAGVYRRKLVPTLYVCPQKIILVIGDL